MRKRSLFVFILSLLCLSLMLTACDDETNTEPQKYTLSYSAGSSAAVGTANSSQFTADSAVTVAENPFTLNGYGFSGWESGGKVYLPGETFNMPASDMTLTAKWTVIKYKVEYVLNGGTNADGSLSEYTVEKEASLPVPKKDGFVFMGWFESESFSGQAIYTIPKGATGNKKYYANWSEADPENTLTYFLNGGTNNPANPSSYNGDAGFTLLKPTREGYDFLGWYGKEDFSDEEITAIAKGSAGEKTLYAKWVKLLSVIFESNGGNAITPMTVREGGTLLLSEIPEVTKGELVFEGWYLDEGLETKLSYGSYQFTKDTVLYAKYAELLKESLTVDNSTEATLQSQPTSVIFSVSSTIPLTNQNLSEYVTLTAGNSRFTLPELSVEPIPEKTNLYQIVPSSQYTAGGNYVISVKEPLLLNVLIDGKEQPRQTVHFLIADTIKSVKEYQPFIIPIEPSDYYLFTDDVINLTEECVLNKNILTGSIIKVESAEVTEHYKIKTLVLRTLNELSYYEATLGECALSEVYSSFDIYSGITENVVCEESEELKNASALRNAMYNNPDYVLFSDYMLAAVTEYGVRNDLIPLASPKLVAEDFFSASFSRYKTNEDPDKYADVWHTIVTVNLVSNIQLNKDVSACVELTVTQTLICATTVQGYLYVDGFFLWEIIEKTDYDFYLYTIFNSETKINLSVSLTKDGKKHEITGDLVNVVDTAKPDSVVAKYHEYFDMKTSELTILTIPLYRLSFSIEIFEFGFPVEFRAKIDVNSIFKGEITATIQRGYSISGTDEEGLSWDKYNHEQHYDLSFASIGSLGLKMGVSVGMEVSFSKLSKLGRVGLELEIGAYFKYYGYGSHRIVEMTLMGTKLETSYSGNSNFYYDFGMYLAVNAYVRSDVFHFDYTKNLVYTEYPLFSGGTQHVILGFAPTESNVVVNTPFINLLNQGLLKFDVFDLQTGERSTESISNEQLKKISISGYYGDFNKDTGKFDFLGDRSEKYRYDLSYTISYYGKHGNWKSFSLYKKITITYLPPELNIDPEDANKMCSVTFTMNGEELYSTEVLIAETVSPEDIEKANAAAIRVNPIIVSVWWVNKSTGNSAYALISDDCEIEASSLVYQKGTVHFTFLFKNADGRVYSVTRTIYEKVGTDAAELVSQLSEFKGDIDENYYRFTGWDKAFEPLPPRCYYEGGRDLYYTALYEKIPFDVAIKIDAVKDYNGDVIREATCKYFKATYGDMLNYTTTVGYIYGYKFSLSDEAGNDPTYTGVAGPTTLFGKFELIPILSVSVQNSNMLDSIDIMTFDGFAFGQDASLILNDPDVIAYGESLSGTVMDETLGWNVTRTFKGWSGTEGLKYLKANFSISPLIETKIDYVYVTAKYNANGGTLPTYMQYQAENGFEYLRGSKLGTIIEDSGLEPIKDDQGEEAFTFAGWYDNPELDGTPADKDYLLTKDVTFYAAYTSAAKKYKLTVYSDGTAFVRDSETGNMTYVDNSGTFADGSDEIVEDNLSREEFDLAVNAYYEEDSDKPISDNQAYVFSYWLTMQFETETRLCPQYVSVADDVLVTFDFGAGYPDEDRYKVSTYSFDGDSQELSVDDFITPTLKSTHDYLNSLTEVEEIFYSYEDENYYYFPSEPICWSTDGITPLAGDATFTLNALSDDLRFYALYSRVPKIKDARFIIDKTAKENFTVQWDYFDMFIRGQYGTELDPTMIPQAKKDAEEYSVYEYVFKGWKCVETNEPTVYDFDDDYSYTPVFDKQIRRVIVTMDATEEGYFPSTGERYKTLETVAGANVTYEQMGETPMYDDESGLIYYDWYFDSWSFIDGFNVTSDCTVEARYNKVRNQVAAPPTGVTISNGSFSEDICYNTIPGYEYHPEEKILYINEPGLTVSNGANNDGYNDIVLWLNTSDVTLCDLKLATSDTTFYVTYYTKVEPFAITEPIIAKVYVKETVEMKTVSDDAYSPKVFDAQSGAILQGVGENPTLTLTAETPTLPEGNGHYSVMRFNSSYHSGSLCGRIDDLTVNINLDTQSDDGVHAMFINSKKLEIDNSVINVDFSGSLANKCILGVDPSQSSVENPFDLDSYDYLETYFRCEDSVTWLCESEFID